MDDFVELAHHLRNRVGETADVAKLHTERLVAPLRLKPGFTPVARHKYLQQICQQWETKLPPFGRLSAYAAFQDSKLRLAELRAVPTRLRYANWDEVDW